MISLAIESVQSIPFPSLVFTFTFALPSTLAFSLQAKAKLHSQDPTEDSLRDMAEIAVRAAKREAEDKGEAFNEVKFFDTGKHDGGSYHIHGPVAQEEFMVQFVIAKRKEALMAKGKLLPQVHDTKIPGTPSSEAGGRPSL